MPQRMALRVERQSPTSFGVFDFIFHFAVADRLVTHDADVSRSITCSDLLRSRVREPAVLNAVAHTDP